ncbi:MAG: hypothetical protein JRH15_01780 [Deltaproteobacteria bacterium]|nr:hypothetical protein [Deltaproteobacteria bacterium]
MHKVSKTWRRNGLQTFVALILLLTGGFWLTPSTLHADPFLFVSLPDTQVYSENRFPGDGRFPAVTDPRGTGAIFFDQTQWIVDNADDWGIRYVVHLGDIVENGDNLDEWARAKAAMDILLQNDIAHGTVMGNHDSNHGPDYQQNYLDNFGPSVFEGRSWYRASSPGGGANFQLLEHEGEKIGFLNLSIDQPQSEVDWADEIIKNNPDTIFILGTHRYLYDFKLAGGRYGETVDSPLGPLVIQDDFEDGVVAPNTGEALFNKLVSRHPNILMIHAGHFHSEWVRLDGRNNAEQTVIQILTDYQSTRNGGDGWLRIYEMDFDNNTFKFETYSPTLDRYRTTIDHFVEAIYIAYGGREEIIAALGITEATYFVLLERLKDVPEAQDGFLYQHPDFDEPDEQAYYNQYLSDLFHGQIPPEVGDIADWEGLWLEAFAANPQNPQDFSDWVRSPSGIMEIDYSAYANDAGGGDDIKVTAPNGGENWKTGEKYTISWDPGQLQEDVQLFLFKDGKYYAFIKKMSNDGTYEWTIADSIETGDDYQILIRTVSNSERDFSDADFSINNEGGIIEDGIKVTAPNGGENWTTGEKYTISWDPGQLQEDVQLFLFKDGKYYAFIRKMPNDGTYEWTIAESIETGDDYQILIKTVSNSERDFSDTDFSIDVFQ